MRWLAALLLLGTGCDKLFSVQHVPPGNGDVDARVADGRVDAPPRVPCTSPAPYTGTGVALFAGVDQGAIPEDRRFAVVSAAGHIFVADPLEPTPGALGLASGIPGTTWAYPSLTPDGSQLLLVNTTDNAVYASKRSGSAYSWSGPVVRTDIGTSARPGALASLPGGELRLVVLEGTEIREYSNPGTGWTMVPFTSSLLDLTMLGSGSVANPSLTPDGMILLVTVTGSGAGTDGVWYVKRSAPSLQFTISNATAWGQLLASSAQLASPYLADDCALFLVEDRALKRYD